jgi:hypothetical protein
MSSTMAGWKSTVGQTSSCRCGFLGRRGIAEFGKALARVSQFGGGWMMADDAEQLGAEEAARVGLTLASLVVIPGSEGMLHEEGITVDRILHSDGDWGG